MTAATDFVASPDAFMRQNIVYATGMSSAEVLTQESLFWVTLAEGWRPQPFPPYAGVLANATLQATGADCPVYFLKNLGLCRPGTVQPPDSFLIYWVPYAQDSVVSTNIGARCHLMFTAKMDGCTFGIGNVGPGGTCVAGHANKKTIGTNFGYEAQMTGQAEGLRVRGMNQLIGPDTYRTPTQDAEGEQTGWQGQGTTYGIRDATRWKIYTQRIGGEAARGSLVHQGVVTGINAQF